MTGPLVVVGDALLDIDLVGSAGRLCPDAPVPVLHQLVEHPRPGGAALAATLAADDGADVVLVAPFGQDDAGHRLHALVEKRMRVLPLARPGATPVKRRVRSGGQTLVRLDSGDGKTEIDTLPAEVEELLHRAGGVLVSDYGRGTTSAPALRELLQRVGRTVPVVWDPHPWGPDPIAASRLVTPNTSEAETFAERTGLEPDSHDTDLGMHSSRAVHLQNAWGVHAVAITMASKGALLSYGQRAPMVVPAPSVRCQDTCGAGDRFASAAARQMAAGHVTSEAVQTAVENAAAFVARGGAASVLQTAERTSRHPASPSDDPATIAERVRTHQGVVVATGGCFDLLHAGHVASLRAARSLGDCLVVCVNSDASVRRLKGPGRPVVPAEDRVRVLEALECVDAVLVFAEETPNTALRRIRPHIWAKGGDYAADDMPEAAVMEEWGGQAVVLPYVPGRSTTELVRSARPVGHATDITVPRPSPGNDHKGGFDERPQRAGHRWRIRSRGGGDPVGG